MVCANVNESFMQLVENCSSTGCKILASHLASSWWEESTMDKIGLNGVPTLCVLGNPYIRGLCEPVGLGLPNVLEFQESSLNLP